MDRTRFPITAFIGQSGLTAIIPSGFTYEDVCRTRYMRTAVSPLNSLTHVASIGCSHCGKQLTSVCGFISRDGDAYSTYFALLHTGHDEPVALLTISIGNWWDDEALNERHWVALTVQPSKTQSNMRIEEPQISRQFNWKPLGVPMNRDAALASPLLSAFFEVADYILEQDPAVNSYLNERKLDISRGLRKH